MVSLAEVQRQWADSHRYGDRNTRLERAKRWLPYYAFLASGVNIDGDLSGLLRNDFVERLVSEKKLQSGDSVLDIGAGTGNYAIPMAAAAKDVTALDVSAESLDILRTRAERLDLDNIHTVQTAWEEFEPVKRFEVSFSAMCTAICSSDELLRMEFMTKRCCGIVTVMPGSVDSHRKAILNGLDIHPDGMIGDALTFYQVLYLMKRYPEVACRTVRYTTEYTRERFFDQYRAYLPIFGVPESSFMPYLESYWENQAADSTLSEKSELHLAMITWNVP